MSGKAEKKIKLLILGESTVGKTALLNCFSGKEFVPTGASTAMDLALKQITIQNVSIKLQVWDTVGQEKFRSITFNLYKDSQGIILAFDLTNPKSFHTLENWMKLISENIKSGFQIVLVGTKCDLIGEQAIKQEQIDEFLSRFEHKFEYFETSSLLKQNVEESFLHLAKKVFQANKEIYVLDLEDDDSKYNNGQPSILQPENYIQEQKKTKKECCSS